MVQGPLSTTVLTVAVAIFWDQGVDLFLTFSDRFFNSLSASYALLIFAIGCYFPLAVFTRAHFRHRFFY